MNFLRVLIDDCVFFSGEFPKLLPTEATPTLMSLYFSKSRILRRGSSPFADILGVCCLLLPHAEHRWPNTSVRINC